MTTVIPVLDLGNISIRRESTRILHNVSWRVHHGEHWVILGANGSGKTSLLSALAGYLMPSRGEILLLGRRYGEFDWRDLRKQIGIVSSSVRQMMAEDEPSLETVISGKHAMIDLWRRVSKKERIEAMRLLRRVGCAQIAQRPWRVLSQGERQRVLIARALMAKPRLLILDEPCAGLDPAAREHFLQFIQRLGREKSSPTLILVTHHVEEIMPVFSHVLVLKAGKVLASGRKNKTLNNSLLSDAFNTRVRLSRKDGRYELGVVPDARAVV